MMAGESQVGSPSEESRRSGGRIGVVTTGIYLALGLRRVVNADARLTRLGGSLMPPEVVAAMAEAASGYVDMHELQLHVGRRLAELTGNEAAFVTTGAAAGLVVATLACTCRRRPAGRCPDAGRPPPGQERGGDPPRPPHPVRPGRAAGRRPPGRGRQRPATFPWSWRRR
jgi:hypothetical protein